MPTENTRGRVVDAGICGDRDSPVMWFGGWLTGMLMVWPQRCIPGIWKIFLSTRAMMPNLFLRFQIQNGTRAQDKKLVIVQYTTMWDGIEVM